MKRKSVVLLILICFWLTYTVFSILFQAYMSKSYYPQFVEQRKQLIDFHLDNATHFLMNQKAKALLPRLENARSLGEFDFFILRENDNVLGYYNTNNFLEGVNHDYQVLNEFQETDLLTLKTIAIYDYKLTIGINKNENGFVVSDLWKQRHLLFQDLMAVSLIVFLIAYLILRDIIKISRALESHGRESMSRMRTLSKEAETLLEAATGFDKINRNLRVDNLLLASSLGPAIRNEIQTGKKTPYGIKCTLARVDLNGYTQMFLTKDSESLYFLLNEYFRNSRDIIERYGGLIYQYIGDEVVCIFKADNPAESAKLAVAAMRTLFEVSQKISTPALPQGLRLKASLASGDLQFIELDGGYSFSGLPLIESVRMLGQVSEKEESRLILFDDSIIDVVPLCQPLGSKTAVFKGFNHESHLLEVKQFTTVQEALKTLPLDQVARYFRGDPDIAAILQQLKTFVTNDNLKSFLLLSGPLRELHMSEPAEEILDAYKDALKACLHKGCHQQKESRFLATLVSLSQNLLLPSQVDVWMANAFDQCEEATDPRVAANTLAVKSVFNLNAKNLEQKFQSKSHRLAAEALLLSGKQEVTKQIADKLKSFLASNNPVHIKSALYVVTELYQFHSKKDAIYVKTNPHIRELAKVIPTLSNNADPEVRTRALESTKIISDGAKT